MNNAINKLKHMDWEVFSKLADSYFRANALRLMSLNLNLVSHRDVVKDIVSHQRFDVFSQYWNETEITTTTINKEITGYEKNNLKAILGMYHSFIITKAYVSKKVKKVARTHGYKIICAADFARYIEKSSLNNANALDFARFCKAAS